MLNKLYYKNEIPFWDSTISHPNYDEYWQKRNTLPHFNNIKPAVMTVGGWFDAEDLYGAIKTYESIENKNSNNKNILVMGPWPHGGWTRLAGDSFGDMEFDSETGAYYIEQIELPFFNYYLKNKGELNLPEAYIFNTGKNTWQKFNKYPSSELIKSNLYLNSDNKLSFIKNESNEIEFYEFISDPNKPVPYTQKNIDSQKFYFKEFMVEDQRFASTRPDVLVFESESLNSDLTIVGEINAELYVSTSGTDSDWIVKIIDVFPDEAPNPDPNPKDLEMGGYQMMVRGEILRGKYRNSFTNPEPFIPNEITKINLRLNDVCHTFQQGHKVMVQIQSSWFPLFDRNPQKFLNIFEAEEDDFVKADQKVYYSAKYDSKIKFSVLEN
ncbi:MAG: CocE/NonD family hydrolase [Melioribacteraceae bacterium]|nr:CocE/NonD family hydrolase [Melioribacteraceae bacterium]